MNDYNENDLFKDDDDDLLGIEPLENLNMRNDKPDENGLDQISDEMDPNVLEDEKLDEQDFSENIRLSSKIILVVDDILYVVKSISKILRSAGYFVITAQNGVDALNKFIKFSPDLVTIDQKLPDMTGYQLVGKIRQIKKNDTTKIIFISAVYEKEEIKSILQLGVNDYLLKPIKKAKLIETVDRLLKPNK